MTLALLTPVPREHLLDGEGVAASEGRVAFGSQAWELFREFERDSGPGTSVLIYASHTGGLPDLRVTWTAKFLRYVESRGGANPDGTQFRPPSTVAWHEDEERYWAGFYEVESLRELDAEGQLKIADLHDRRGKRYGRGFAPEGPIIISAPYPMGHRSLCL